jgi:oxepin-CoA hydrolase/3-oxo-5,6-dehydrosuberyl-CoA semialdehyde dehydrogenase
MKMPELTRQNLPYFVQRLQTIESDQQRKWGKLTPAGLMRHLRCGVEVCLVGGPPVKDKSIPVVREVIRLLFFHWFTRWPRGMIPAPPEMTPPPEGDLTAERTALISAIEQFVAELDQAPEREVVNMILGPRTLRYWAHIHGVHFHHHFRQFGVIED